MCYEDCALFIPWTDRVISIGMLHVTLWHMCVVADIIFKPFLFNVGYSGQAAQKRRQCRWGQRICVYILMLKQQVNTHYLAPSTLSFLSRLATVSSCRILALVYTGLRCHVKNNTPFRGVTPIQLHWCTSLRQSIAPTHSVTPWIHTG